MGKRCSEVREHLAAYSLGALDASVRRMVDKHLDSCPDCRAELVEYLQVADGLLESAPAVTPPAGLRARLIKEISGNQLAAKPGRHWLGKLPWNVAGALAIGLLLVLNLSLLTQARLINDRQKNLLAQMEADRTVLGLSVYPETRMVSIQSDEAYGTLVYEPDFSVAVLYTWGLSELDEDETYQAWLIEPTGGRVSGGTFNIEKGDRFTRLIINSPTSLNAFVGLGVTIEPAGGSLGPTGPKVLGVDL